MKVEIDSAFPHGEHGDEPAPHLTLSYGDRTLDVYIEDAHGKERSAIVRVDPQAIVAAIAGMVAQEHALIRADAEFTRHHRPGCAECSGFRAAERVETPK